MRRTLLNRRISEILRLRLAVVRQGLSDTQALEVWGRAGEAQVRGNGQGERHSLTDGSAPELRRGMNRRMALALLGAGVGAGLAGCVARRNFGSGVSSERQAGLPPVVIIGGGLAGLTCAYRLSQQGRKVALYEASARFGGRVMTQTQFNASGQFVELGAELVDSSNVELLRLLKEFGLQATPYSSDSFGSDQELFYFEGQPRTAEEFYLALGPLLTKVAKDMNRIFGEKEPYFPTYRSKNLPSVIAADQVSLERYFQSLSEHGEPWVLKALGLAYETEYGGALGAQSSLNFLSLADTNLGDGFSWYGASDEWGRVEGGNSRLTARLLKEVSQSCEVHPHHALESARFDGSKITLGFRVENGLSEKSVSVTCDQAVLAIPFSVLRGIKGVQPLVDQCSPLKRRSIAEFSYGTNAKYMTSYKNRYWRKSSPGSKFSPSQAAVLSDLPTGQYWETSRAQPGQGGSIQVTDHGILTNFLGGSLGANVHRDSPRHLTQILSDVGALWPSCDKNFDGVSVLKAWPSEPLALGSYSSPSVGQYTSFLGVEGESELGGRLHFAGEHTSTEWLGYMEGAIESGTRVAQTVLSSV